MIVNPYPRYMRSGGDILAISLNAGPAFWVRLDYRRLRSAGVTADEARMIVWGLLNAGITAKHKVQS